MRTRFALIVPALVVIASAAVAQRRTTPRTNAAHPASAAPASAAPASGSPSPASAAADAGGSVAASADAAATNADATAAVAQASGPPPNSFDIPMVQRGTGAMVHYPIPEQLVRNDIPVFVQVRSSAPIDHVAVHYRGRGARSYTSVPMPALGSENLGLPNGYGAVIPCEDAFPPAIEYYVDALATSGVVVGTAGTEAQPITVAVVRNRTRDIVPTLPGRPPPRNCGGLTGPAAGGTHPAGANAPEAPGTADLGEPCTRNNDCRHGLRCGTNHHCVFVHQP